MGESKQIQLQENSKHDAVAVAGNQLNRGTRLSFDFPPCSMISAHWPIICIRRIKKNTISEYVPNRDEIQQNYKLPTFDSATS